VMLGAHLLVCQSLLSRFRAGVWQHGSSPVFFSVPCHGETLSGLGVQGVEVLILLAALFPPSVAPVSPQVFRVTKIMLSASAP
jgi:hypothetical protein